MATQVDPRYFGVGNAFLGGFQQSQDDQRRNALLDLEQQQFGLQDRRQAMAEDEYMRSLQAQQAQGEQAQRSRAVYARLFEEAGLPAELADTEGAGELAQHLIEQKIAPGGSTGFGNVNPGDYTPQSLAKYAQTRNYADLERQYAPMAPATVMINGVPTLASRSNPGQVTPLSTPESEIDAAAARERAVKSAAASAEIEAGIQKKGANADTIMGSLDLAEPLVDIATGSGVGAARDKAVALFGSAPEGAQAIAKLKIIQAGLILNMPRLEGPQSDRDQLLYREAAGQIGDPSIPAAQKKAAISMIRSLQLKYADRAESRPTRPGQQSSGAKVVDFSELPD